MMIAYVTAFAISLAAVWYLSDVSRLSLAADLPNERSLHTKPVSRLGGLGMFIGVGAAWLMFGRNAPSAATLTPLLLLVLALVGLALVDDIKGLGVRVRFAGQAAAAALFLFFYSDLHPALLALAFVTIVWMSNLYNFMDGSNGMAAGMALFGFLAYAVVAHAKGADGAAIAMLSGLLVAAALGFLVWNFDPARIFMGDAGSVPLGFLAATLGILGWQQGHWPFWFPALAFLPFILDATVTLAKRALRRERLSQAHRSHYYQRVILMGGSHRATALGAYVLMASAAATAVWLRDAGALPSTAAILFWLVAFALIFREVDRRWAARAESRGEVDGR